MFWIFLFLLPLGILGHGSLIDPPSRAAMNKYGFPENPVDVNYNQGFCGGFGYQHSADIGGRCGICGDPWGASPRDHEAPGGKYANGIITKNYQPGSDIPVKVLITANHKGFFIFRLCKNNNVNQDLDQSCFEETESLLRVSPSGDYRFYLTTAMGTGELEVTLRLPNIQCDQCIIQWTYTTGNNWGWCGDGSGKLGCGPQETFRACSDISIDGNLVSNPTLPTANTPPESSISTSSSTTPSPVTVSSTTQALPSGSACSGAGAWEGDDSMANWCTANCNHVPRNCPGSMCRCDGADEPVEVVVKECLATGPWTGNGAMNSWCADNCNNTPAFCPSSMCAC